MLKENTQVLPKERAALKILPEQYSIETAVTIWKRAFQSFILLVTICVQLIYTKYIHKNSAIVAVSKVL